MKKFTGLIVAVVMLVLCFTLSACGSRYVSKYSSKIMISKNTSDNASVSFAEFSGTYVIKFRNKGDNGAYITYNATLNEGIIKVYYDFNDEKLDLFEIENGGLIEGKTKIFFTGNKTIYIIIESEGKCNTGSFSFALEQVRIENEN